MYKKIETAIGVLTDNFSLKVVISGAFGLIFIALGGDLAIIVSITWLIVIDWVVAILAAIKNKHFSSWYLGVTLYKILFYLLLMIMAHQALTVKLIPDWFDDLVYFFIALTEIKSILENSSLFGFKYAKIIENKINEFVADKIKKF